MDNASQAENSGDCGKNSDDSANHELPNPQVRVNYRGTPYVRPSDIYRSKAGQAEIRKNLRFTPGGYLFVTQYFATRYLAPQWSGYRLFFNSAIAGASFFGVSVIITTLIKQGFPEIQKLISQIFPSVYPYLDASVLAFALGSVSWVIFNFFAADKEDLAIKYAEKFGGPLQVLLAKAVKETRQVSITLKSGKVYIGFVTKLNEAQDNKEYILIWPQRSGYRDSNTKKVTFTTNYAPVYQQIEDNSDEFENITIDDFQTAIPTSELESISIFDSKVSEAFRI